MLQRQSVVKVADNTGARTAMVVGMPGYGRRKWAKTGDLVVVAVQLAFPKGVVKEHEVHQAVIVRTRKEHRRDDGSYIRFDDNAVVLLEKTKKTPLGTRVFGPISRELKERGYDKIISLAPEVL
jgi:large subunit ribosomal protein L14